MWNEAGTSASPALLGFSVIISNFYFDYMRDQMPGSALNKRATN
jgi:hypothetical protein